MIFLLGIAAALWVWRSHAVRANREYVDRLTWYMYVTSYTDEADRQKRWQAFAAYLTTAKWT